MKNKDTNDGRNRKMANYQKIIISTKWIPILLTIINTLQFAIK